MFPGYTKDPLLADQQNSFDCDLRSQVPAVLAGRLISYFSSRRELMLGFYLPLHLKH